MRFKIGDRVLIVSRDVLIKRGYPSYPPCRFLDDMAGKTVTIKKVSKRDENYVCKEYPTVLFYEEDIVI